MDFLLLLHVLPRLRSCFLRFSSALSAIAGSAEGAPGDRTPVS